MRNKSIVYIWLWFFSFTVGQDITIFFLKDGSIFQGKIVNENQHRIFLKTDQGTIKIIPSDIIGREDTAAKGDLTFFSDRLQQLQGNVKYLTGKVGHMKDSLNNSMVILNNLYTNLEAIQNEFEIELLRMQSITRQHDQKIEYNKDDLINNRVQIAENRQQVGGVNDTLRKLNKEFYTVKEQSKINLDQLFLLSGSISTIKKDIQLIKTNNENSQNQIDMMAGALANNIQEVIRVQGSFSDVENGIKKNSNEINDIRRALIIQKEDLIISLNSRFNTLNDELVKVQSNLEQMNDKFDGLIEKSSDERKQIKLIVGDLENQMDIINEKITSSNRNIKLNEEKVNLVDTNVIAINKTLIKVESELKSLDNKIAKIDTKLLELSSVKD